MTPPGHPTGVAADSPPTDSAAVAAASPPAHGPLEHSEARDAVLARLWSALAEVEDPEIPVSLVDMGLIISVVYEQKTAKVKMTYTAMGCPAMDMIQDDIRARLIRETEVDH